MNLTELIETATRLATEATQKYGPVAWETTLWAVRVDAAATLVPAFLVILAVFFYTYLAGPRLVQWAKRHAKESEGLSFVALFVVLGVPSSFLGIPAFIALLSVWSWVQLFWPELYLAHEALEKVLK